ncbi:MAG: branched-chain amino acid ABC transporter permease [Actinomycetota bacterium]|jgi:branched-chain amino acid transport system permease protein|nr:branched-chain amino acid ABC transporter permease [Actinomycetota bacterium]
MARFLIEVIGTLSDAGSLFMVAAGLTLIFGAMRVINLAHGSLYMYGAFLMTTFVGASSGLRFWWSIALAAVIVAALGAVMELGIVRFLVGKEPLTQLVATFALFLILADTALHLWGNGARTVVAPSSVSGRFTIAGVVLPVYDLVIIGVAVAVGIGLWALLRHTSVGWRIRAAVDDPEVLESGGVNLRRLNLGVFAVGALLAGIAGAVVTPQVSVAPGMDESIIVTTLLVVVIGGLGSVTGTALAALVIGIADTVGTLVAPTWASTFMYLAVILVLVVRPWGLLGTPER